MKLAGEVAIVTGAGRGFGKAISKRLAAEGAAVVLLARNAAEVSHVAEEIRAEGGKAVAVPGDATIGSDVERSIATAEEQFGPVTLFVNNAGVAWPYGPIAGMDTDRWWEAQKLHQLAPMLYLSRLLPRMAARRAGRIVLVSSRAQRMLMPNFSPYAVGKKVLVELAKFAAEENRDSGLAIFSIDPGFLYSDLAKEGLSNPDAQKHIPEFLDFIRSHDHETHDSAVQCAARVVELFSGRYDHLSGSYIEPEEDLDSIVQNPVTTNDGVAGLSNDD